MGTTSRIAKRTRSLLRLGGIDMGGASTSNSHHGSFSGKLGKDTCFCGLDTVLLQSKTADNPGRWFWRCPLWESERLRCTFFSWDGEDDDESEEVEGDKGKARMKENVAGKRLKESMKASGGNNKLILNVMLELIGHMKKKEKHMRMMEYYLRRILFVCVMLLMMVIIALIKY